jgi:serine/threonine protein kinase
MKRILSVLLLCQGLYAAQDTKFLDNQVDYPTSEESETRDPERIKQLLEEEQNHLEIQRQNELTAQVVQEIKDEVERRRKERIRPWMKGSVENVLQKFGEKPVLNAVQACEMMWKLRDSLGISRAKLFKIALYIETKFHPQLKKKAFYLEKSRSGLARAVEYDPKTKLTFIHLNGHVGTGCHKKVTRSIIYDKHNPELVANLTFMDPNKVELGVIRKLKNQPGIATTYAITKHKEGHKKKKVSCVMQKLYTGGSLYGYLYAPGRLTKNEIMLVSRDLAQGLETIHKHDFIHRDMHGGNFIVDLKVDPKTKKQRYYAVITDFGQALSPKEAKAKAPRIQVPHRWNAPEAFWRKKTNIDPKAAEVYALGITLYHLYFGTVPEWGRKEDFSPMPKSDKRKVIFRKRLARKIDRYINGRKQDLGDGVHDRFAKLVLSMCHPSQYHRPTAHEVRQQIDVLVKLQGLE